jgi:hypothetical protein
MNNLDPLNSGYTDHEYAQAILAAHNAGIATSVFVVVNHLHFLALLADNAVEDFGGHWYKKTTLKPLWFAAGAVEMLGN